MADATPHTLARARWLGVAGSAMALFIALPAVGGIVNLAGFVLLLFAVRDISRHTGTPRIFRRYLAFLGSAVAIAIILILLTNFIVGRIGAGEVTGSLQVVEAIMSLLPAVAVYFFMKTYTLIARATGIRWFSVTGTVNFTLAVLVALVGATLALTAGSLFIARLGSLFGVLSYAAVPILGVTSYALLPARTSHRPAE